LDAHSEKCAEGADREDIPGRPEIPTMKEKPQKHPGHHRDRGSAHLRPKELLRIIAGHSS
jgi:hypothetical protein